MAQKAHVPKFGNWDSDNIPYTAYFEKARRDKSKGDHEKVIMNPNDPQDNPEAFLAMEMTLNRNNSNSQLPPLPHVNSSTTSSNYRRSRRKMSNNYYGSQNNICDQSIPSTTTTTERSSSDSSNLLQQRISRRSARSYRNNKSTTYASDDDYFSAASHIRQSSGSTNSHSIDHQQRAASIPKFGTWDETDPKSGENFTIIFNKVKKEKQNIASAQFSTPSNPPHAHNQRARSYASKICCCLF